MNSCTAIAEFKISDLKKLEYFGEKKLNTQTTA